MRPVYWSSLLVKGIQSRFKQLKNFLCLRKDLHKNRNSSSTETTFGQQYHSDWKKRFNFFEKYTHLIYLREFTEKFDFCLLSAL